MATKTDTDTASEAKGRFVVSLPADVGEQIDAVGAKLTAVLKEQTGVAMPLSRAQVVQALVRQHATDDNGDGEAAA